LAGDKPLICASIVNDDVESIRKVESLVDLYELRIDLVGRGWREMTEHLKKPWIACNRRPEEGGSWRGGEPERISALLEAVELGAGTVDIELSTPGITSVIGKIKGKAECLVSYHNLGETLSPGEMGKIVKEQRAAGADICKVVTTARNLADNIAVLQLITDFPETRIVSFAMGAAGQISRVLCTLAGGYFTYASIEPGSESADGQITAGDLRKFYKILGNV
jgi:3-dehydroquinate dehydratase-1